MLTLSEEGLDWLSGQIPDAERSPKGGATAHRSETGDCRRFLGASMRRQSRGFEDSSSSSFVFCGSGIGLPSGLGVLVHVLIRRLPQRRNVAISISRSLWWSHCTQTAIVPNRPSSVGAQEFPPNACRGERCGVWGAEPPSDFLKPL